MPGAIQFCKHMAITAGLLGAVSACSPDMPGEADVLFPGVPHVNAVAGELDVDRLFGPVPEPRFRQLDYVQEYESASQRRPVVQYIESVTPVNTLGPIATLRSEYQFTDGETSASEVQLQVADLLRLMRLVRNPVAPRGEDINRSYVDLIEHATGYLFPLRRGNRMDFTVVRIAQYDPEHGRRNAPRTLEFEYTMGVVGRLNPQIYPQLELTDTLWVINIEEIDPDGSRTERQVHFSTEVGMPVFDVRRNGSTITRRRLMSWLPATGPRRGQTPRMDALGASANP